MLALERPLDTPLFDVEELEPDEPLEELEPLLDAALDAALAAELLSVPNTAAWLWSEARLPSRFANCCCRSVCF